MRWVRSRWIQNALVFVVALAIALSFGIGVSRPSGPARITVLPVGDAITYLIEDDDGRRIIVGGGGTDAALRAFSERTWPWERRVDMLVLPPPFRDHLPGATEIVRRTAVGRVIELGGPGAKPPARYDPWQLATLDRGHIPERLWGHATIPLARGATLDLIAPEAPDGIPLKLPAKAPKPSGSSPPAAATRRSRSWCCLRRLHAALEWHDQSPRCPRRAGRDASRLRAADRPDAFRRPKLPSASGSNGICSPVGAC